MRPELWARIKEIFAAAAELAPGEREVLLDAECAGQAELRAEIESLLAAHDRDEGLLDAPVLRPSGDPSTRQLVASGSQGPDGATVADVPMPQQLGPYRLLEVLGRGGMGVVYRGEDIRTGEPVAVKTVRAPGAGHLHALRREIQALARIQHPGIVRVLGEGLEQGVPWYAMELVPGTTLRQRLRGTGGLPSLALTEALRLVRRLCDPLAFLHGEGLVHRDLKPENILLRSEEAPVLLDFGLASRWRTELSREALEVDGNTAGTVAFMAPEQIRGDLVDARADLYALGCILYELATGHGPFVGKTLAEVIQGHLTRAALAPSQACAALAGLPAAKLFDYLVLRLLQKQPRQRLGHAEDVALALDRILQSLGVAQPEAPQAPRPRPYLYRPGFFGRQQALERLEDRVRRLERGRGGLVLIEGESGVGKTRLALEVGRLARGCGLTVLTGECLARSESDPGGMVAAGPPLQALRRPLQAIADRCRNLGPAETDRLLGERGKLLALYEPALQGLPGQQAWPDPAQLPAATALSRVHSSLTETLLALASSGPVLLLLDDLQWADELTLGFLEHLFHTALRAEDAPPLLVLGTCRSDEVARSLPGQHLARVPVVRRLLDDPAVLRLELGRLDASSVGTMVSDMLAVDSAPAALVQDLVRESEGNPFFVAEYLWAAVAEGPEGGSPLLWRNEQGVWQVPERLSAAEIPSGLAWSKSTRIALPRSLRQLVLRRLRGLPASALRVVEAAAVLGRESEAPLLGRLLQLEETHLAEPVQELLRRQVLEELLPGQLRFAHDKLREAALGQLDPARRCALHRAAAELLESWPDRELRPLELACHWEQAGESERARPWYLDAARQAMQRYLFVDAVLLYRAWLWLTEVLSSQQEELGSSLNPETVRARILVRNELGRKALWWLGRADEALSEHEEALAEAQQLGDPALEAESLWLMAQVHRDNGRPESARPLYEQALALQRRLGDSKGQGMVLGDLATLLRYQGQVEEAEELGLQALELHRQSGDRLAEGNTLSSLAALQAGLGRMEQAQQLLEQALALHQEADDRRLVGIALGNLAILQKEQGRPAEARLLYQQALEVHRQTRNRRSEGVVLANLTALCRDLGEVEDALSLARQAVQLNREVSTLRPLAYALKCLADLELLATGDPQRAEVQARQAQSMLEQSGDRDLLVQLWCCRGHIELASGRSGREFLERARSMLQQLKVPDSGSSASEVLQLEKAVQAFERDQQDQLCRGYWIEGLPQGLQNWLRRCSRS